ncbi:ammonium transporter AMT2a [Nitzschia inconspicua]|uniref:Ammonium transporter n=1 Tax=Nitzschia inconspicua TaxID=303405 RepID=A0A9K3Q4Q7_9STRA|nr:ammonium transporter AMT2a [Nitzschia inconspicua]
MASVAEFCDAVDNSTITVDVVGCSAYLAATETDEVLAGVVEGLNVFFLLFAGAVVFLMQAGFAMLCAGSVRQKNVKNIMLKNLLDACGGAIGFYTVGYAFAYGTNDEGGKNFIGTSNFFIRNFSAGGDLIGWFFQFAFAATAATIVAGTVAERCKMAAYLCYSVFLTGFVYPVVVHSIWSADGFLTAFRDDPFRDVGNVDFAGSGVVHMTGGATALVAAIVLGPRKGRFYDEDGNPLETPATFQAHSVALQILGTFILWFGWYGFNPGSALAIDNPDSAATAALCAVTTTLAAACGCATAMFFDSVMDARATGEVSYDLTMAMNGCLAGLVGITAGCSVVQPWAACIIGVIAGLVYYGFSKLLVALKIDDAVDAVPVHFANGMWGVLAVGFFADPTLMAIAGYNEEKGGVFYGVGGDLLIVQIVAVLWIVGWVTAIMTPFFLVLNALGMFRVDALEEEVGLDISHHRGSAYDLTAPKKEDVEELMEVRASRHGKVEVPKEVAQAAETEA